MTRMLKRLLLGLLGILMTAFALLFLAVILLHPEEGPPVRIDFTRYVENFEPGSTPTTTNFKATSAPGRLLIECEGQISGLSILINAQPALPAETQINCAAKAEVSLALTEINTIEVTGTEALQSPITIRVKQQADIQLHVLSRVHFNTNVSNFAASREFYRKLGFATLSGFPDTNTEAMARAIGIKTPTEYDGSKGDWAGGYLLHGELIGLGFSSGAIDLIEFTIPRDEAPPYAQLNHLGMARAVLLSDDLDVDHRYLSKQGIRFLSAPVTRSDGTRFVIFKDLDGTFYELADSKKPQSAAEDSGSTTHLSGFGPLNVNVSDFERSRAWYQMFGYGVTRSLEMNESAEVAAAMGFVAPIQRKGAILTHRVDGSTIELTEWIEPFDAEPPHPTPVNHLGIHRTALTSTNIVADVATLKSQGVEFVSPITPCCSGPDASGSIVAFYDPDGTIVELVEQPLMSWLMPVMLKLRTLSEG